MIIRTMLCICILVLALLFEASGTRLQADTDTGDTPLMQTEESAAAGTAGSAERTRASGQWSPYLCGIGIGILCWLTFLLSDRPLGISTAYAKSAGMLEKMIRGEKTAHMPYYRKFPPEIGWEWMLVLGVIAGAFVSATLGGNFYVHMLPGFWIEHAGATPVLRWLAALCGGICMGIGSRWADGCTSGHGISGTLQLAVSSWLVVLAMFAGGSITAFIIT